ncbi:hypothetical protein [Parvularcula marina]|uniref:Pentapeptide repeat-containing protein n=1 Tax=Parvularcula marina TaxID=2292771 RepID=A0A371RJR3_9PROT|nr:hypothetical protein [Parvularcula marina]RFB05694.1 hypothetical protein DX908_10710 [Parvularcula marina]
MEISTPELQADCSRCEALCCFALAFVQGPEFPFDKSNGEACPNLDEKNGCRIYTERDVQGYAGCAKYDCLGAGQRLTQEILAGRSWREEPSLMRVVVEALPAMREVHELLGLLKGAAALPLNAEDRARLEDLCRELSPEEGWTADSLSQFRAGTLSSRVHGFLQSLRPYVRQARPSQAVR